MSCIEKRIARYMAGLVAYMYAMTFIVRIGKVIHKR